MKLFLLGTAREGSTRVKKKMVRPFVDTSLHAIQLKKFEELMDDDIFCGVGMAIHKGDETLWEMSKNSRVPVIERNNESVTGLIPRSKELHFLKDIDADYIMWVNGCLPFLNVQTLRDAANMFIKNSPDFKSMTSVKTKLNWYWDSETKKAINNTDPKNVSTQKSPPLFETAHAFHIFNRKHLLENDSYWNLKENDPYLHVIEDELECQDIDSELDFKVSETLWNLKNGK
jgi:CMP-N-acetylneuraminic acid synthetase